jgi:hypothetical protein
MNNGKKLEKESSDEFCQRLGIRTLNEGPGSMEWGWNGPHKKKKTRRQLTDEFCKRHGIKQRNRQGGVEFVPYHGEAESEIPCSDVQDQFDALPEEFKEHLWAAFINHAGYGPNPGKYAGPPVDPDDVPL